MAAGDVNNDGDAEIIVGPQQGPNRKVKVFDVDGTLLFSFFPYGATFTGAVRVAAGDLGFSDGRAEIVTARSSGTSLIKVWDVANLAAPVRKFAAFSVAAGNFVAVGNVDNDAQAEVIVGAEGAQPPRVRWFDVSPSTPVQEGQITAYTPSTFQGGVRVGVLPRFDAANRVDILTTPGLGIAAEVKRFDAVTLGALDNFFAYEDDFLNGAFVAGG